MTGRRWRRAAAVALMVAATLTVTATRAPALTVTAGDLLGAAKCDILQPPAPPAPAGTAPLRFGVSDNPSVPPAVPGPMLSALRGGLGYFGVHTYLEIGMTTAQVDQQLARAQTLTDAGYDVVANVNTINHVTNKNGTEAQFLALVKHVVDVGGPALSQIEITNEPNVPNPSTSDGLAPNVIQDVVQGVILAKSEAVRLHLNLQVGFNWVYSYDLPNDPAFWLALKSAATAQFLADLDWMGLHTYPNLNGLDTPVNASINVIEHQEIATARCWTTWLGMPRSFPIDITEIGYPTPRGSAEYAAQAAYWSRVLPLLNAQHGQYGIRTVFAFYFQDGTSPSFGLYNSAGVPKPAESVVAALFSQLG